ncbi:unnamed protein product [Aphanomyces euteiches]|uniref:HECT-type E3 ubiquitin transferase n=1 Tax=Aphanomyces euteiches TaxID=100861 RepID=A0A6G0XQU9_9STRA|nr:hypothetical protein Ae201684_002392 [Aphanomyces euteiches]KAH9086896.1 hypothetical protein Ae201684P_000311 [Aphanomyces euteiches]KAH9131767.1 hypothetical protein AeRB84_021649 [Aphanomyces euteiches]
MDSTTVTWVLLSACFTMLILPWFLLRIYWRQSGEALLPNEIVGHLEGLTRDILEDRSLEATKWICGICDFHNATDQSACVLCHTTKGIYLLERREFVAVEGTLRLDQLNIDQWAARNRKQWLREFQDQNWKWLASRPLEKSTTFYSVEASEPNGTMAWLPLADSTAGSTVLGDELPSWWFSLLQELRDLHFSLTYAWLLSYLSYSYNDKRHVTTTRDNIFKESLWALENLKVDQLCSRTKVTLKGEVAVDAGGVSREWYTLLTYAIFEPKRGLFIANKTDQYFFINPNSERDHGRKHLEKFHAIGRLLGRAIVDEQVLPFHFSVPLFKMILGYPISMDDIRYLDPTVHSSLEFVRDSPDVEALTLTFSVSVDATTEVDLIPNGRDVAVTNFNKAEYVERMVRYLLFDSIAPQLQSMIQGLYEVLPPEVLMVFDYKELELVLCGFSEIDVSDWRRCTTVSRSLEMIVDWFWDIVEFEMTSVERERFLQFTTGSSRVPLQGFKGLTSHDGRLCPFSLRGVPYTKGAFPKVHSCFNRIDLPVYPTRELLREGLFALVNIESMAFTLV